MPGDGSSREDTLASERDLYRRLLDLGGKEEIEPISRGIIARAIGKGRALAQLLHSASHVAPLDVDVLITGPSGTGKSMLARALHVNSPRSAGPFVELNCAAIPEALSSRSATSARRWRTTTGTSPRPRASSISRARTSTT